MKIKIKFLYLFAVIFLILAVTIKPSDLAGAQGPYSIYLPIIRHDRNPGEINGMYGGTVECVAIDPNNSDILYAGSWGNGIYKSSDGGVNWIKMSSNLQSPYIYDIAVDPHNSQHILVSVYEHGVNQSFDGGRTWESTAGLPTGSVVYSIEFHPQNPSHVFAGLREPTVYDQSGNALYWPGGVFKSFNGGSSWVRKSNGLPNDYVYDIGIDPNNPNILYTAMHNTGVYKSFDGGEIWYSKNGTLPADDIDIRSVDINPTNSNVYIAHWDGDGFSFSTNGGDNWVRVVSTDTANLYVYEVLVDKNHPSTVYLATVNGIYLCENPSASSTCSLINHGGKFVFDVALDINGQKTETGLTKGMYTGLQYLGMFKSNNTGSTFAEINKGIHVNIINSLLVDRNNPSVQYASAYGRGIYKSVDNGLNWFSINNGLTDLFVNVIKSRPGGTTVLYAGTQSKGVFISSDGGASWYQSNSGLEITSIGESIGLPDDDTLDPDDNFPYDWMDPVDRESLQILEEHQPSDRAASYLNVTTFSFDPSNPGKMIAGTNGAGVKLSDNGGASWKPSYYWSGNVYDSFTDPSVGEYFYYIGINDYSIRVSDSSRLEWNPKNSGFHGFVDVFSLEKASDGVYYAGSEIGIYKTSDAGESWTLLGLNNIKVTDILVDFLDRNIIWAATPNGLYRSTNGGLNWGPYSIDWLVNKDILTLEQIPGSRSFYIGTNGGNFYYFSP